MIFIKELVGIRHYTFVFRYYIALLTVAIQPNCVVLYFAVIKSDRRDCKFILRFCSQCPHAIQKNPVDQCHTANEYDADGYGFTGIFYVAVEYIVLFSRHQRDTFIIYAMVSLSRTANKFFLSDCPVINADFPLSQKQVDISVYAYTGDILISVQSLDAPKIFMDKHFVCIIYALIEICNNKRQIRQCEYSKAGSNANHMGNPAAKECSRRQKNKTDNPDNKKDFRHRHTPGLGFFAFRRIHNKSCRRSCSHIIFQMP